MSDVKAKAPVDFLSLLFLLSGLSALIYQVAWQRILFAVFGADIQSVTIVVSAFMLGLGTGALAGGVLADRFPRKALLLFALCELGIGGYGLLSSALMHGAGDLFAVQGLGVIATVNFLLVLIPATLMGGTLPILVRHVAKLWGNVGEATGQMYSANTFGAALGAVLCGFVLLNYLTLSQVILLAGAVNFAVAIVSMVFLRSDK
ncbi:fused MFS/spermidine synthase [Pseudomonas sp. ZM23]|uniref:Fused MFS/spermidine synthase n=1 Tax=Pseudomonas triclosanedens TaxID=2961893 RepID=A0ABY7A2Y1_9PSED|nr:fused MFS/spermidine synthase [Pseudomonas triclosanedens]MCP8463839.1 fused MFS/spermidine synthase [Pseudomonas triclosanedens]MCP8468923.1 fused MFS/spermidine synthase [Pseudomonas triclosanedens]MCP8475645.1 fused MFS/spermidine synthase [Pseudomonas triclosanedens]WAI50640.1 fused MFS/spermidine synthase [Pseudomonas triclosanedens]